ncbi:U2 snRNP component prp10 [Linderina macrospora]|uniref:U2 snRNP component prp10 n=1 Tax=Linderina macrospora TaxID=4868 RepID=A0ACC1JHH6_9FUNG|nr:U2 snRNP component prp10 [Linderina macrospora]
MDRFSYTAPQAFIDELRGIGEEDREDPFKELQRARGISRVIAENESDYEKRRHARDVTSDESLSYSESLKKAQLEKEKSELLHKLRTAEADKKEEEGERAPRKRRWDQTPAHVEEATPSGNAKRRNRWDETPRDLAAGVAQTPRRNRWDETPKVAAGFGETPKVTSSAGFGETPRRSRWDETPVARAAGSMELQQQTDQQVAVEMEDPRNAYMTDDELDALLPSSGYTVMEVPASYIPIRTPARKLMATPASTSGFHIPEASTSAAVAAAVGVDVGEVPGVGALPFFKQDDMQHFGKLLDGQSEEELGAEERTERAIMRQLLKIKNGTAAMRKAGQRQLAERARTWGASAIFNQMLPLLLAPSLEEQERHVLVKAINRVLFRLGSLVRPFVRRILTVIEPMLVSSDAYARAEGCEVISNVSKAAGLAAMVATLRPDVDHADDYVRNTTARALAVVASALGISAVLPFVRAVCASRRSWQARHTGCRVVQQIAELVRAGVLPHLRGLVACVGAALGDEQLRVRTASALALAALAEASAPYGIEAFDDVLRPLWAGVGQHRGRALAAFLKAIGFIVPLMDAEHAGFYAREIVPVLVREFATPDDAMRTVVLRVVSQCVAAAGVSPQFVRTDVLPGFMAAFWVRRMALDRRSSRHVIAATVELAAKVGASDVVVQLVSELKDESEPLRRMALTALTQIVDAQGVLDVDARLEERLVDGVLYAFQEQTAEGDGAVALAALGAAVDALGLRARPYLPQLASALLWRLGNQSPATRQQAADAVARVAPVLRKCGEDELLARIGTVLYECLGEEYPEVLGSVLGALTAVVDVIGMADMRPPIGELLPRLTPILKNRHEKVQQHCIELVGRIADRGAEHVGAREWMRSCFSLLDLLRANKKAIRRASVSTFGYIAKAIGPQDVLATLLNNLKVQERQNRVCTTVAIAIVAETCAPFTVLPVLLNEYRVPELNVQNGVLKAVSFLFEYIGAAGADYVASITPLLEDALTDRDLVHRQQAASAIRHLALGVSARGCEPLVLHLLNLLWPNVFEASPHAIRAVLEAIDSSRVCLGAGRVLLYVLQGLFHPARRVREVYWRIYNMMYVGSQPAMVAFYPPIVDDPPNTYCRHELDYVL